MTRQDGQEDTAGRQVGFYTAFRYNHGLCRTSHPASHASMCETSVYKADIVAWSPHLTSANKTRSLLFNNTLLCATRPTSRSHNTNMRKENQYGSTHTHTNTNTNQTDFMDSATIISRLLIVDGCSSGLLVSVDSTGCSCQLLSARLIFAYRSRGRCRRTS